MLGLYAGSEEVVAKGDAMSREDDERWQREHDLHVQGNCGEDCRFCEEPMDDIWLKP